MKDPSVLNSHSMSRVAATLTPRKSPVQARSTATIGALHVAAIQVLTREGLSRCTTTRISERAGMSVGSLYQYYPNRDALLAAVLEQHLDGITDAVEQACRDHRGKPVSQMASALVTTFVRAKLSDTKESKALYAVAEARGGARLVGRMYKRMVAAVATMLAEASDARFEDPTMTATIALGAMVGPVRTLLEGHAPAGYEARLEEQLIVLVTAFFRANELE
jgi:AcrR family transcriptional regulator